MFTALEAVGSGTIEQINGQTNVSCKSQVYSEYQTIYTPRVKMIQMRKK